MSEEVVVDWDFDGTIDSVAVTTFDARGDAVAAAGDSPVDGVMDGHVLRTFDSAHRPLTERKTDGDGATVWSDQAWTYDEAGRVTSLRYGPTTFSSTGTLETLTYHREGVLVRDETSDDTGRLLSGWTVTLDARRNAVEEASDWDGDGLVDHRHVRSFDAGGNLRWEADQEQGAVLEVTRRLDHGCFAP